MFLFVEFLFVEMCRTERLLQMINKNVLAQLNRKLWEDSDYRFKSINQYSYHILNTHSKNFLNPVIILINFLNSSISLLMNIIFKIF